MFNPVAMGHVHDMYLVFCFMSTVMFGVICSVFLCMFAAVRNRSFRPNLLESSYIERVWTVLPMILVSVMAVPSTLVLFEGKGPRWPFSSVHVIGHQWYWEYHVLVPSDYFVSGDWSLDRFEVDSYGFKTYDESFCVPLVSVDAHLLLPSKVPMRILFTSEDVVHNYNINSLGISVDCVPGRMHYLMVEYWVTGLFSGFCSENCGVGHYSMPCCLEVVEFSDWFSFFKSYSF